ncbi:uncharacterized protein LOC113287262 isoform X2 [Papaver somniferum]|uniref:uncharacterized protein LOC113287262 isoform X2 n=1 Tax=Papaver somniferum TaxID=3469 RepID=UPI000E6F88A3|nr:uncharacterized protein LOC113287262 isoform X2 [Papaver somniferum]
MMLPRINFIPIPTFLFRFSVTGAERFSVCRRAKHVHSTCLCKSLMILMRLMFFHTDHRQKGTWYVLQFKMHPDLLCLLQAFRTKTCLDYQQLRYAVGAGTQDKAAAADYSKSYSLRPSLLVKIEFFFNKSVPKNYYISH